MACTSCRRRRDKIKSLIERVFGKTEKPKTGFIMIEHVDIENRQITIRLNGADNPASRLSLDIPLDADGNPPNIKDLMTICSYRAGYHWNLAAVDPTSEKWRALARETGKTHTVIVPSCE